MRPLLRLLPLAIHVLFVCAALPARAQEAAPTTLKAGFGDGITVSSGDGLFSATLRARGQFRAEATATEDEDPAVNLMVRRLRASLKASALDELFDFVIQLSFAPRDLEPDQPSPLRDAHVTVNVHRDVRLRVGQMKVPFDRQRMVSSSSLSFPDRALAQTALTLDRDVGAYWLSDDLFGVDVLKAQLGVFGGDGRNRLNTDAGLLYVARAQVAPLGNFDDLDEVEFNRTAPFRFAIAAAVAFNDDTPRERSTTGAFTPDARADFVHATVDAVAKTYGMSAFGALYVRAATEVTGQATAMSAAGGLLQLGGLVTDHIEVVGRVAHFEPLPRAWLAVPNPVDLQGSTELRPGVNFYVHAHDAKVQTSVGLVIDNDGTRHADGQVQLQLFL